MKSLGQTLKEARELNCLTQRQVEEAIGISNAYLSLLENDKIKKPSANVLYKLSSIYKIDLDTLLIAAGIIETTATPQDTLLNQLAFSSEILSPEEHEALMQYLRFLRSQKNG